MKSWTRLLVSILCAAALAVGGCGSDDDSGTGEPQVPEPTPEPGAGNPFGTLTGAITAVEIDTSAGAVVTVTFTVNDRSGLPVSGLSAFEVTVAKLLDSGAYPRWQSYINRSRLQGGGANVLRAVGERPTASTVNKVAEVGTGIYQYTIGTDIGAAADFVYYGSGNEPVAGSEFGIGNNGVLDSPAANEILPALDLAYDPTALHRISIAGRDSGSRYNATIDFVPADLPALNTALANQVVTNQSCGSCHGNSADRSQLSFPNVHGDTRYTMELCVTCHNEGTFSSLESTDTNWAVISFVEMIHRLHGDSGDYAVAGRDYGHVHYPQPVDNCLTCHDNHRMPKPQDRSEEDAVAYQRRPSSQACGTCHEVNFSAGGFNHFFADEPPAACLNCHGPGGVASVDRFHISDSSTPNNPLQPQGLVQFAYEIDSVTLDDDGRPIVTFRLLANGEAVDLQDLPGDIGLGNMRLIAAWSVPQPGGLGRGGPANAAPDDFNNLVDTLPVMPGSGRLWWDLDFSLGVRSWDQPQNLGNVANIVDSLVPSGDGYFTTAPGIVDPPFAFPHDAILMAVAIEGRPQSQGVNIDTTSRIAYVGAARRVVVAEEKCLTCHETLGLHGGSRVNNPNLCVTCHNPEVSSSNLFSGVIPEDLNGAGMYIDGQRSMNLKDLVHGLHAGKPVGGDPIRETPFSFIRGTVEGGQGQGPYDFSDIGYPAALADCQTCHLPGTYGMPITADALWSVVDGSPGATSSAPHEPGMADRIGPTSAACYGCHDTAAARAHFEVNTSFVGGAEACSVCHGAGQAVPGHDH